MTRVVVATIPVDGPVDPKLQEISDLVNRRLKGAKHIKRVFLPEKDSTN